MQPRWRKSTFRGAITYRGGTETFDIGLSTAGTLWVVWADVPFHWATFDRAAFYSLAAGKSLGKGRIVTAKELRDLRNYVRLFVPEFEMEDTNDADTTL